MKMALNKSLAVAALSAALISSFYANASSDVTLKVIGSIVPGACVPTLPNGGVVDYGTWRSGQIDPTGVTNKMVQLGQKDITLTVTCDSAISVAVSSTDNRTTSRVSVDSTHRVDKAYADGGDMTAASNSYGLGLAPDGTTHIGFYTIAMNVASVKADGSSVDVLMGDTAASTIAWTKSTNGAFCASNNGCTQAIRGLTVAETGTLVPKAFTTLTAPLLVTAAVQDNTVLGATDAITLDGNATISLVYL